MLSVGARAQGPTPQAAVAAAFAAADPKKTEEQEKTKERERRVLLADLKKSGEHEKKINERERRVLLADLKKSEEHGKKIDEHQRRALMALGLGFNYGACPARTKGEPRDKQQLVVAFRDGSFDDCAQKAATEGWSAFDFNSGCWKKQPHAQSHVYFNPARFPEC
eukprot:6393236-Prymnesium_polylepis.1